MKRFQGGKIEKKTIVLSRWNFLFLDSYFNMHVCMFWNLNYALNAPLKILTLPPIASHRTNKGDFCRAKQMMEVDFPKMGKRPHIQPLRELVHLVQIVPWWIETKQINCLSMTQHTTSSGSWAHFHKDIFIYSTPLSKFQKRNTGIPIICSKLKLPSLSHFKKNYTYQYHLNRLKGEIPFIDT